MQHPNAPLTVLATFLLALMSSSPSAAEAGAGVRAGARPPAADAERLTAPVVQGSVIRLAQAASGGKVALVIGNASYPDDNKPLAQPIRDARAVADELRRAGFEVTTGEDLTKQKLRSALDGFKTKIRPGMAALLFFSGYGIQTGKQSYLIPIDAQIWTEGEVRRDGTSIESILADMNSAGATVKVVIVDAARRNPFERRFRGVSIGLASLATPAGTLAIYSAAPDKVAYESEGDNSVFVGELLKEIRSSNLSAEAIFNNTRMGVSRASRNEQVPWVSSSLVEEFFLNRAVPSTQQEALRPPPTPPSYTPPPPPPPPTPSSEPRPPDRDRVIQDLDVQIDRDRNNAEAYYRRGQAWAERREYALASEDFGQAIRLNPNDAEAFNNRCFTRAVLGQLDAALADCNEALRLKPNYVDALDSRGLANLKSGNLDRAVADYDQALRFNPRMPSALFGRGKAKMRKGDTGGGNVDIGNARVLEPTIDREFESYGIR